MTAATTSPATERGTAFVAAHREDAASLGRRLADSLNSPDAFVAELQRGFAAMADREYREGQHVAAPGLGPTYGVRNPLLVQVRRSFDRETRADRPSPLLFLADRLYRERELELRWFAFGLLERTLAADPERTWQLLRRAAREAGEWITVDTLARPYARGILAEPYRWAELEQLVFSPSRWERRLVGSTIATIPYADRRAGRVPAVAAKGLELLGMLIGDAEPDVQKALSWAYRSLCIVDLAATTAALEREAATAATTGDGSRAWVVRDSLVRLDPDDAERLRAHVDGIRRRPGAGSTSTAADLAARFGGLPDPSAHPEPPLT